MKSKYFLTLILGLGLLMTNCVVHKEGQTQKLGEFIVQLKPDADVNALVEEYKDYACENKQTISKRTNMYLIGYNELVIKQDDFRKKLEANEKVLKVELNTKVSNRD